MSLVLRWKGATTLTVEGDSLSPANLGDCPAAEAARRPIPVGNGSAELGDLFEVVEFSAASPQRVLRIEGDLSHVQSLGRSLSEGVLFIDGSAGAYLGAGMSGGSIEVTGDTADWAGAEMTGGLLRVRGSAGQFLGASLPGSRLGMREGMILVHGSVGDDAGRKMRRGLIAVAGNAGTCAGRGVIAGTILVFGRAGRFAGAGMKRGTLGLFGGGSDGLLPGFERAGDYRFPFLTIYLKKLKSLGFPVPEALFSRTFERYNGDLSEGGQGEILALG
jgi:formylmethanofuran dehydrogenase subunit C